MSTVRKTLVLALALRSSREPWHSIHCMKDFLAGVEHCTCDLYTLR